VGRPFTIDVPQQLAGRADAAKQVVADQRDMIDVTAELAADLGDRARLNAGAVQVLASDPQGALPALGDRRPCGTQRDGALGRERLGVDDPQLVRQRDN
jgi:hypothetical protein